ncbi:MAG: hypothetical protein DRO88_05085 [Promethearchaeia archaeon]|nr:MAG: hypothetical protein DRO88_05085 [Candidatus Lokiarchaeia archaeon]
MFEEETLFEQFSAELGNLEAHLYSIRDEAKEVEEYSEELAEDVLEKVEDAMEILEEATELQEEVRELLVMFLDKAADAARLYDKAQNDPTPAAQKEAAKSKLKAENARQKLDKKLDRLGTFIEKIKIGIEKANTRLNIAKLKVRTKAERERNKKVRINFTLPENMKDDWKSLADELGISVSEMIRDAMEEFKQGMKSLEGLDKDLGQMGKKLGKFGKKMSKFVESQVQNAYPYTDIAPQKPTQASQPIPPQTPVPPSTHFQQSSHLSIMDKERLKKRITGLIRIQNGIPVDKLAQALKQSDEDAENLIYELVAEGIDGKLEGGVFKYKNKTEEVIETFHKLIDRM